VKPRKSAISIVTLRFSPLIFSPAGDPTESTTSSVRRPNVSANEPISQLDLGRKSRQFRLDLLAVDDVGPWSRPAPSVVRPCRI
jgi:hypothetical protein